MFGVTHEHVIADEASLGAKRQISKMNGLGKYGNYLNFQTAYGFYIGTVFQKKSVRSNSRSVLLLNIWGAFTQNAYLCLKNVRCWTVE